MDLPGVGRTRRPFTLGARREARRERVSRGNPATASPTRWRWPCGVDRGPARSASGRPAKPAAQARPLGWSGSRARAWARDTPAPTTRAERVQQGVQVLSHHLALGDQPPTVANGVKQRLEDPHPGRTRAALARERHESGAVAVV